MTNTRRAFLAAVGTLAVSGCSGRSPEYTSTTESRTSDNQTTLTDRTTSATDSTTAQSTQTATDTTETTADREPPKTTIGFAGDTMVGRGLNDIYGKASVDPASIWGDFRPQLESLDGVFCNLECCISTHDEPAPKRMYHFRGDPEWAIPALSAGNVRFTNLANNHAMDYGTVALMETIDLLDNAGIANAGTGKTEDAARAPASFSVGDLDVAVVSFSFAYKSDVATDARPGIAWDKIDPDDQQTRQDVGSAIDRAKSTNPDVLMVSLHWGENWVERPNDRLVAFGHWLVDQGVDLVHGHSAHVVQAVEQYGDGVILHDTGDLVDDFGVKDDLGNHDSYLFEVTFDGSTAETVRLVPFHIDHGVSQTTEEQAAWLRKTMRDRSEPFDTMYERDGDGLVVHL